MVKLILSIERPERRIRTRRSPRREDRPLERAYHAAQTENSAAIRAPLYFTFDSSELLTQDTSRWGTGLLSILTGLQK